MGNTKSALCEEDCIDLWWPQQSAVPNVDIQTLRERRIKIIGEKKKEMDQLREDVERYKRENEELKKKTDNAVHETTLKLQKELESAKNEIANFESERKEYREHVIALKDVVSVSKQLLMLKENQMKELNEKISEVQKALADKELEILSEPVRKEYEKQLNSIKQLKLLYEERETTLRRENSELKTKLNETTVDLGAQESKNTELNSRVEVLEKETSKKADQIFNLESQLGLSKADCKELQSQLNVINQLFSHILISFNSGQEVDLEKLIKTLEENHDLLTDIVLNEECDQASSALPKVLLDLVNQMNDTLGINSNQREQQQQQGNVPTEQTLNSASEIVQNLPKVWRVLIELLSHQTAPVSVLSDNEQNSCYKSVQTPTGTTLVLSVSKTFIRLKNLIVEKKSLEKETMRLKQLNTHLETRLQDQEKRLEMVSHEVTNTWHVVGKMQKQHQLLHTQENILRYELAQKRKLLNELKEELEYCREKWLQAREKNSITEKQWKQLQSEFASRKRLAESVESGYSDDRESSTSDSDEDTCGNKQNILKVVQEEIENIENSSTRVKSKHEDISDTYKKLEEHILETIKKTQNEDYSSLPTLINKMELATSEAKTSAVEENSSLNVTNDSENVLQRRERRLRQLEEETKQLVNKVAKNANRGDEFCSKLNMLHDRYGDSGGNQNEPSTSQKNEEMKDK
ncbi:hypothetical protein FQA39_LY11065 [Lamprigera yunnana]|nr:hypothetical protein FQA39_LY11065 [Lamprigera yunnana]